MKVLIIGANGMLGQELVRVFGADSEVLAWDREEVDITDEQATSYKLQAIKPNLVINAAAYTDVDGAETNEEIANQINGYGAGNAARACQELGIPLVHYSTEYVFEGTKKEGYSEADEPNPVSAYGRSKFLGEQELHKNTDKFYLIRLSRLFGGEAGEGKKRSFVELMLDLAKTKSEIDVVDEEISCPTYALDLAELTKKLIMASAPYGIYHGANDGACTWLRFAEEIFEAGKIDVKLIPVPASRFPRPAKRPKYGVLLNTKLPKQRPWQEALREHLNFTKY